MAVSLEQIFHTEPKRIGMIEIYSNPMDRAVVKDIETVVKSISKSLKINLDNIPSGEVLRVYIYPTKRVFYSIFGSEIEKNTRKLRRRGQEDLLFVVGEGEIHMVSPRGMASQYTNIISILVKNILSEYQQEDKAKKAQDKVREELEPEEVVEEELEDDLDEEEIEEDEPEEDIDDLELDEEEIQEIEEIDEEIERLREKNASNIPEWLELGWIMYKRGILKGTKNKTDYAEFISKKGVTSQNKIAQSKSVVSDYNYASESAAAIVEYIVQSYGVRKILELFENPNVEKTLGISKAKFSRECKESIKKRYVNSKLIQTLKENEKSKGEIELKEKEGK